MGLWDLDQCSAWITTHHSLLYPCVMNTFLPQLLNEDFSQKLYIKWLHSHQTAFAWTNAPHARVRKWLTFTQQSALESLLHLLDQDVRWVMFTELKINYVNLSNHNTAAQTWNINKSYTHFPCKCPEENFIAQRLHFYSSGDFSVVNHLGVNFISDATLRCF